MNLSLVCARCGAKFLRSRSRENYRLKRKASGPYCSPRCASRLDDPRETAEPEPVLGAKWIRLTREKFALVDEDVFDELNSVPWRWQESGRSVGYASSGDGPTFTLLHHAVLKIESSMHVDHKNNNGLDCRRENLRVADRSKNGANRGKFVGSEGREFTSRFKGVIDRSKHIADKERPWLARIRVDNRLIHIGRFATEHEAAHAYDAAATKHFGEFARLNFPTETRA